jgi:hypothetical protein
MEEGKARRKSSLGLAGQKGSDKSPPPQQKKGRVKVITSRDCEATRDSGKQERKQHTFDEDLTSFRLSLTILTFDSKTQTRPVHAITQVFLGSVVTVMAGQA